MTQQHPRTASTVNDIEFPTADEATATLGDLGAKAVLVVNVASRCGLTPQYEGLEALQRELGEDGLQVIGFPCNQFGAQEPGTDDEIQEFCSATYGVTFPVAAKIEVNGPEAHALYVALRAADPGEFTESTPGAERLYGHVARAYPEWIGTDAIKWNFTKFLVDSEGRVVRRYEPFVEPEELRDDVVALLERA